MPFTVTETGAPEQRPPPLKNVRGANSSCSAGEGLFSDSGFVTPETIEPEELGLTDALFFWG